MKCPRCVQRIHRGAEVCPQCGFEMADADVRFVRFGGDGVVLRCLADGAGLLRRDERAMVEVAMERFSRRFPQLFVAVYTGSQGGVSHLRQFGFWLLNRGAFEDVPADRPNEAGVLLVIDPESKVAGMTFGYLLDPYLEEADTFECLSRAHSYWLEGRYAEGILKALAHLDGILTKRCGQARRHPEEFERKVQPPPGLGDGVRRMRAGHRAGVVDSAGVGVRR